MPVPDHDLTAGIRYLIGKVMDYRVAKVLLVATDLRVFTALSRGGATAAELAADLHSDPRATRILLDALVAIQLLNASAGRYTNSEVADRFLVEGRPDYKGNNLRYQEKIWSFWSQLGDVVRTGRPARTLGDLLSGAEPGFQTSYIRGMHDIAREPARVVASLLQLPSGARILDVGGGPGSYAMALLEANPGTSADILDLPATLAVTRSIVAGSPVAGRIGLLDGNYLTGELPGGYDLALLSHITHDESPEANRALFARVRRALSPGGRIAVHDFVVDDSRAAPAFSALFAVNMLVYTEGGATYSTSEYRAWLMEASFEDLVEHEVLKGRVDNPSWLVVGARGA